MPTAFTEIFAGLAAPLPRESLRQKQGRGGEKLTYTTARGVQNRLDEVLGPENWWARYSYGDDNELICRLTVRLPDGSRITKIDIGAGQGNDAGTKKKAQYSDALKRAAVQFGVGRHLYRDGVPPYVRAYLGLDEFGKPTKQPQVNPPPTPTQLPSTRAGVNETFSPTRPEAKRSTANSARAANDKESVKMRGDRIGARGLDVRPLWQVIEEETGNANTTTAATRADLNLEPREAVNAHQVVRHVARVAAERDVIPDPYLDTDGQEQKQTTGQLSGKLAIVYVKDGAARRFVRKELKQYLRQKVEDARQIAENEAHGDAPGPDEPQSQIPADEPEDAVQAEPAESWAAGRA